MTSLGTFATPGQSNFVGVIELCVALVLILGAFRPPFSARGALSSVATYLMTLALLFSPPVPAGPSAGLLLRFSAAPGQFLMADAVLLASLVALRALASHRRASAPSCF